MKNFFSLCAFGGLVLSSLNGCAEAKKPGENLDPAKKSKIEAAEKASGQKEQEKRKELEPAKEAPKDAKAPEAAKDAKAPEAPKDTKAPEGAKK